MKKVIAVAMLASLFTGCAQVQEGIRRNYLTSAMDLAKEDCQKMGYREGAQNYLQCVQNLTISIRNERAQREAANQAAMPQFTPSPVIIQQQSPRNYDCRARLGGRVECTGY
jgi:hypothetical protein